MRNKERIMNQIVKDREADRHSEHLSYSEPVFHIEEEIDNEDLDRRSDKSSGAIFKKIY